MNLSQQQALENQENTARLQDMMDEAKVKKFLLENPNFLVKNPELLTHIELKYGEQETFSLVERQVKTLRDKNSQLQGQQIDMLHAAHANEELLITCNQFMLDLLECSSLSSLISKIVIDFKQTFNLDDAAIILVGNYPSCAPAKVFSSSDDIKQLLNCQFPDNQPLCGRVSQVAKETLFGEESYNYQSCALIPLGQECKNGLIALASKDVSRFGPEMGTLFIELISKYIASLVIPYEKS